MLTSSPYFRNERWPNQYTVGVGRAWWILQPLLIFLTGITTTIQYQPAEWVLTENSSIFSSIFRSSYLKPLGPDIILHKGNKLWSKFRYRCAIEMALMSNTTFWVKFHFLRHKRTWLSRYGRYGDPLPVFGFFERKYHYYSQPSNVNLLIKK